MVAVSVIFLTSSANAFSPNLHSFHSSLAQRTIGSSKSKSTRLSFQYFQRQTTRSLFLSTSDTGNVLASKNSTNANLEKKETKCDKNEEILAKIQETRDRLKPGGEELTQEYCDNLLSECVAYDEWEAVLDVLDLMKKQGLRQVRSSYRACLQKCFEVSNAASSKEILSAMKQARISPDPTDFGLTVLTMCKKNKTEKGWGKQALALVREHDDLPISAYDAVLSCIAEDRQWQESLRLLRFLERTDDLDDNSTKTKPAISTYRIVISCLTSAGQAEQAIQVLQSCVRRGLIPTSYSFELVVSALSKKLQWRRAMQLLELMDQLQLPKSLFLYNSVIAACAKTGEVGQAKNMLVQMRKNDIKPDIISFNSVISACASKSRWKDALSILDQAHREPGVTPDVYTYTNAIRACAKGRQTQKALTLFKAVKDKGLPLDSYCYTAAIEACSQAGLWQKALDLLNEMETKNIEPSEVTFSVTIKALGNGLQWRKALDLLALMRERKIPINLYVYNAAITAISKSAKKFSKGGPDGEGNLYKEVMSLLDQMRDDGIEPDGFSFSSAISCCGSEGRWKESLELIDLMQKGGPKTRPNKIAYTAAISSCGKSGQVDHAMKLFRQMKDQGLQADRVAYNALFSALRVAKKADAAIDLWYEMLGAREVRTAKIATAGAYESTTPDIITVTDAIAAMSADSEQKLYRDKVDEVFAEAVQRRIVLRDLSEFDVSGEVDLSGMSFPVARAACRFIMHRVQQSSKSKREKIREIIFITGVGAGHEDGSSSLRDFVQEILVTDFTPPIEAYVPDQEQSTVHVKSKEISSWIKNQAN